MLRAKFQVNGVWNNTTVDGEVLQQKVTMNPVYSGSDENRAFWEATPTGSIELFISNKAAFNKLVNGKAYYIDFTPAEA